MLNLEYIECLSSAVNRKRDFMMDICHLYDLHVNPVTVPNLVIYRLIRRERDDIRDLALSKILGMR